MVDLSIIRVKESKQTTSFEQEIKLYLHTICVNVGNYWLASGYPGLPGGNYFAIGLLFKSLIFFEEMNATTDLNKTLLLNVVEFFKVQLQQDTFLVI